MLTRTPIIVTHLGNPTYLRYCLEQAKRVNPENPIYLIGDSSNHQLCATHFDIESPSSPLLDDISLFRSIYKHNSHLRPRFESFCIERWFLVRNLMRHLKLNKCCAIDSDVLLFCHIDTEAKELEEYSMTFCEWDKHKLLPHFNLIQNASSLEAFCDFVIDTYSRPNLLRKIINNNTTKAGSWVCDMTLFKHWSAEYTQSKVAIFDNLDSNYQLFDPRISSTRYFKSSEFNFYLIKKWKKLRFRNGLALVQRKDNGNWQSMKIVHYHGIYKVLMKGHFNAKEDNANSFILVLRAKLMYELKRIADQVKHISKMKSLFNKSHLTNLRFLDSR